MRYLLILAYLLFFSSVNAEHLPLKKVNIPGSKLENCYEIDKGVYRSEQPSSNDFRALEKFGVKEVINLRNWHSDDDEAKGTKIKLHRFATRASTIDQEEITEILRTIKNRRGPVLFHCLHGSDRTGAVCAMYRIVFQNVSKDDAIKEMTEGGFGFHMIFNQIITMIKKADIEKIKKELELN